jgi:hypothetical protein
MRESRLFEAATPLGFRVYATPSYWDIIVSVKHPVMLGREEQVLEVLRTPDEIRQSLSNPSVFFSIGWNALAGGFA